MKGFLFILLPSILAFTTACRHPSGGPQASAALPVSPGWLEGTWASLGSDSSEHGEVWTRQNDTVYAGYGFRTRNGSRVITETLALVLRNDSSWYSARVREQNDNRVIRFRLTALDTAGFVCENPDHDFPTRIEYMHRGTFPNDSVVAVVSGPGEGNNRHEITFAFGRRGR